MKPIFHLDLKEKFKIEKKISGILLKRDEITFAYLFGSFTLDIPFHDIDLAIFIDQFESKINDSLEYELQLSIDLELQIHIPVDIKIINNAPLSLKFNILKGKILFSRTKEQLYNYKEKTCAEYLDLKPYYISALKYLYNIGDEISSQ